MGSSAKPARPKRVAVYVRVARQNKIPRTSEGTEGRR